MTGKTAFHAKKRAALIALFATALIAVIFALALFDGAAYAASDRYDVTATERSISAGVTETKYYTNNETNDDQVVAYTVEVDLSQNTLFAGYKNYDTGGNWGMDTVRNHVSVAEKARGVKVVAAVNGDFFNMATGEPTGALVMNGRQVHASGGRIYFAILKDTNKAVIRTGELQGDEAEAIGAASMLIQDGTIVASADDTVKQPRTAVGIKEDGTVVLIVADGRQAPYSSGYSLYDLACKLKDAGCVVAANLDGGGSTTYLAKYAGSDDLTLANSPSDGQERSVSSSLMVVSNAEPTGIFDYAEISPNNLVYTPGSTVSFTATGADTAGFPADIPQDAYWRLNEADEAYGEISASEGGTATFTSKEDAIPAEGTDVTVELVYQGKVVGSSTIELRHPDTIYFSSSAVTLAFGERSDLGLTALWKQREVSLRSAGDLEWIISPGRGSDGQPNGYNAGVMDGNIFVADEEATDTTSTVTVRSAADPSITASVEVSVGQSPTIVWNFEDVYDEETQTTIAAEDYYSTTKEDSLFSVGNAGRGAVISTRVVSSEDGYPVRMGSHSLRVDYDFTTITGTDGAYFGEAIEMVVPGKPTGVGVWMYTPAGTRNLWLRAYVNGYKFNSEGGITYKEDENGNLVFDPSAHDKVASATAINFTEESQIKADALGVPYYSDYYPEGWRYYEAPIATASKDGVKTNIAGDFYTVLVGQALRLMAVPGTGMGVNESGKGDKSYVYFDDFQFVYGVQTADTQAPDITYAYVADRLGGMENMELQDGMTITSSVFQIHAQYTDYNNRFDTGVIPANVHIYVDGNELQYGSRTGTQSADGHATSAEGNVQSLDYYLPNGKHRITIEVGDYSNNITSRTYVVNVQGDAPLETVTLEPSAEAIPFLNSTYTLDLLASDVGKVESVTFEMTLRSEFDIEAVAAQGFEASCQLTNEATNTYTVTVTRTGEAASSGEGSVAEIRILIPKDLAAGIPLVYSVSTSKIVYTDGFQETVDGTPVVNSFCLEDSNVSVEAYYEIATDILVVGNNGKYDAYIYVTHDGVPAAGVTLSVGGVALEGVTDEDGKLALPESYLTQAAILQIRAEDEEGRVSYATSAFCRVPAGESEGPMFVSSKANQNAQTQQYISWLSNPLSAEQKALVRYMTLDAYNANGQSFESGYTEFEGDSRLLAIGENVTAAENTAVLLNTAQITGLDKNTRYVYIVGDGTVWSEVHSFSTTLKGEDTNFFVIGDTQAENAANIQNIAQYIGGSGLDYSFGIQTGDFVDSASSYAQWAEILGIFSSNFSNVDMIHVLGNHEYAGDFDGDIASSINMLASTSYYSVTYGNTYVAVINYCGAEDLQKALAWVQEDALASDAIWKVLTLHQPPYYTNPTGGNDYINLYVPPVVDAAGIDVVFSGHDHAYARTLPMTGGKVDELGGAVYYICGSTGEKSYAALPDESFNFAVATNEYDAVYLSVKATSTTMEITTYNLGAGGLEIFDTCTISKHNACAESGHSYVYDGEYIYCTECGHTFSPVETSFSGLMTNEEGKTMFFSAGKFVTDTWINIGVDEYYFDAEGYAGEGEMTVTTKYGDTFTFVFENGIVVGGDTGWTESRTRYYENGVMAQGWREIDGTIYYFLTGNETTDLSKMGYIATGAVLIKTPTVPYMTNYLMHFHEDGSFDHGDFHQTGEGRWVYTRVRKPADPNGIWVAYRYNQWVDTEYGRFYAQMNSVLATGDYEIDGITYKFSDSGSDPKQGFAKLLGRYYDVRFVSDGETVLEQLVFQDETVSAPSDPVKQGNSIKSYTFAGWFDGEEQYAEGVTATKDVTYTARFTAEYSELYEEITSSLAALQAAQTPSEKHLALDEMTALYQTLSEEQIADCVAENASIFDLYKEMLSKLYDVTFVSEGQTVSTVTLYEGETITAPADPAKQGNSIKSYTFVGWFNGDEQFGQGDTASASVQYTAKFDVVYTQAYTDVQALLSALSAAATPAEKHAALDALTAEYQDLTQTQIADMEAEGLSFDLYKEMLSKLYDVTFVSEGQTVSTVTLYEGETITAPADPAKQGNSVRFYTFVGWFSGENKLEAGTVASADATYTAQFTMAYTQEFEAVEDALEALAGVSEGTLEQKYGALTAVYAALSELSEQQKADAVAEGLSFEQYESMLAEYNALAQGAEEDLQAAKGAADKLVSAAAAVLALAAAAYAILSKEVIL